MSTVPPPPKTQPKAPRVAPGLWTGILWSVVTLVVIFLSLQLNDGPLGFANGVERPGPMSAALVIAIGAALLQRYPLAGLAVLLGGALRIAMETPWHPPLTMSQTLPAVLALCWISATRPARTTGPAVAMCVATLFGFDIGRVRMGFNGDPVNQSLPIALLFLIAWLIGRSVQTRRQFAARSLAQATEQAVTEERLRIARELHDMVAHSIGIIVIQAGVGSRVLDTQPEEARSALQAIEATSRETLSGLRRTLVALRQADPEESAHAAPLAPTPGLEDLPRLAESTGQAGIRVDLAFSGERRPLPGDIDLSAYRIVQEALTNVVRHAGTRRCRVLIDYGAEELALEVLDDGRGVPTGHAGGGGFGITGMRERVSLLHGEFSAGPRAEGGFRVAARLPLPVPAEVAL